MSEDKNSCQLAHNNGTRKYQSNEMSSIEGKCMILTKSEIFLITKYTFEGGK